MNKICCFAGHSKLYNLDEIYHNLVNLIERLILEENISEFWVGNYGDFDKLSAKGFEFILNYEAKDGKSKVYNARIRDRICTLAAKFKENQSPDEMKDTLTEFYRDYGVGKFGLNKAFRVVHEEDGARIVPIRNIAHVSLDDLVEAFKRYLVRKKDNKPLKTKVTVNEISVSSRRHDIKRLLKSKKRVSFFELFPVLTKEYVVATFLAVLEMAKSGELTIKQEKAFDDIICEEVVR